MDVIEISSFLVFSTYDIHNNSFQHVVEGTGPEIGGAVQIRVPVVATVVPKIRPGGRLQLVVEEPHHAYHTALSSDGKV